jgi:hypothetical protein
MAQTRVVTYPSGGGRKLESADLNVVLRNTFNFAVGEVITVLEMPLSEFRGLKFFIEGFNSTENKFILKEYSVLAHGISVTDNCSNILSNGGINFAALFFIEDEKLKLEISNLNDFLMTLEVVRVVIGGV